MRLSLCALAGALALVFAACQGGRGPTAGDAAPLSDAGVRDAIVYEPCETQCLRPSDCAIGYPDDDRCPAGFLCARSFTCTPDM